MSNEMQISEAQLRAMTADMDEMHRATFPRMYAALTDVGASVRRRLQVRPATDVAGLGRSRRRLLLTGGGLVAGSALLSACGGDDETAAPPPAAEPPPAPDGSSDGSAGGGGDAMSLKLNASLENLAVFAYTSALEAAPKGKFGKKVPPAVAEFAKTAMSQHDEHAQAFNAALEKAGEQPFTEPTPALAGPITQMFEKVDSIPGLAMLALTLENTAAATYVKQMEELSSADALSAVATIAPVERQHAAILSYILGEYPIPDTFVKLDKTDTSLGAQTPDALNA